MLHRIANRIGLCLLALFVTHARAANQAENVTVALPWNTLTIHANQTLVGSTPNQYSVKNLFDPDLEKAWVFHGEEEYYHAEQIKNPAVLTLMLSHPSALFAIMLTPGYNKSTATQFQNSSPRNVLVKLYRLNDAKPFESRRFLLSYSAREYSMSILQKELKNVEFVNQTDDSVYGKSDNSINSAERMLLVNHGSVPVAKIELEISTIAHGAKFTDVAISKLRLLDRQADQNTPEYRLLEFIDHDLDHAVHALAEAPRCLVYTAQNPWLLLRDQACTGPAPKVQFSGPDQDNDAYNEDVIVTRRDPVTHEYQIPFSIALRDAMSTTTEKMRNLRVNAGDIRTGELILGKSSAGQFQAVSGLTLTETFVANQHNGMNRAYKQNQDVMPLFFDYSRLKFVEDGGRYLLGVYGPVGSEEVKWIIK